MPITSHFDRLRRAKAHHENRDLPLRVIAEETGLSVNTLQRVRRNQMERVYLSTIETLCRYFGASRIDDLIELKAEHIA